MVRIREDDINAIRNKAGIVDIISRYLPVYRKGKSYTALCPFHDDHTPSLSISEDKQIYKCFVCGAGGNVFSFVQNYEKITFPEAVVKVASLIDYPLDYEADDVREKIDPHKETLYRILEDTIKYSMYELNNTEAKKQYLEGRGLDERVRQRFEIGYNPPNDALYRFLKAKGYTDKDLYACNVIRSTSQGFQDVFTDRILFPIHDAKGHPAGFSARTLDPKNPSKYINTNETEIFEKGKLVYNAHRASGEARRQGRIYVTEGVTDVIAFDRAGVQNCVCTLGTACTKDQIRILKDLAPKIVFCYDGDDAGQNATFRAAKMAMNAGADVSVIRNTGGMDPDEIIRSGGKEALLGLLKNEISWGEFVLQYLGRNVNFDNYLEKKEFARKALQEIEAGGDAFDIQHFREEIEKMTGLHLENKQKPKKEPVRRNNVRIPKGIEEAKETILMYMIRYPYAVTRFTEKLGFLSDPVRSKTAMLIVDRTRKKNTCTPADLIDATENEDVRKLVTKLATDERFDREYNESVLDGAMRRVRSYVTEKNIESLSEQLKQPMNEESRMILLQKYQESMQERRRYIDEDDSQ
ncbi:MAG: DNA primase [Solobacterium sp.]|nr:DNA primase [Solobacterium sp.]